MFALCTYLIFLWSRLSPGSCVFTSCLLLLDITVQLTIRLSALVRAMSAGLLPGFLVLLALLVSFVRLAALLPLLVSSAFVTLRSIVPFGTSVALFV